MNGLDKNKILDEITRFYLESDFLGILSEELSRRLGVEFNELFDFLRELISERNVGIFYTPPFMNPNIIGIDFEPEREQIKRLIDPETQAT